MTHEEANAATKNWPRKSSASGGQHAQTPSTRVEAMSPCVLWQALRPTAARCKEDNQRPPYWRCKNSGQNTTKPFSHSSPYVWAQIHRDTFMPREKRNCLADSRARKNATSTNRRHAVTFPRTACCLTRDETIDSGKRIPKETKVMTEYHHDNES